MPARVKPSQQELLQDLFQDNAFFDELVNMIPAKLYVAQANPDSFNPKYYKGQAKDSKEERKAQSKLAKRQKLNPKLAESTTQAKQRLEAGSTRNSLPPSHAVPTNEPQSVVAPKSTPLTSPTKNARIDELRAKLHAKLAEKRAGRPTDPNIVSKRAARRADKKKRQEAAAKRKAQSHAETTTAASNKTYRPNASTATNDDAALDLAQIDFGRLQGLNSNKNAPYSTKTNKSLANISKTKNLQKLLADAEAKRQRLEELKQGSENDQQKAANMQWGDAIKEASGERVKDDPAKLKKALKRQATKKSKSAKAWKSRMEQTKQSKEERQKIRSHNLNKRKEGGTAGANLSRKRITLEEDNGTGKPKNGRRLSRAGFEGRKQDFLNDHKRTKKAQ